MSNDLQQKFSNSNVYIFSSDLPGVVVKSKIGERFIFDGLDPTKAYKLFLTTDEPGNIVQDVNRAAGSETSINDDGEEVIATEITVTPAEGIVNYNEIDLKATGTIKGVAKRFDVEGEEESDHAGTTIFVPGTSYSAFTDKDGNFALSGLPQGEYTIRAQYANYSYAEQTIQLEAKPTDDGAPEAVFDDVFNLAFSRGIVRGTACYSDSIDINSNSGIDVVLINSNNNNYSYPASTINTGSYSFVDVYPGTYTIEFHAQAGGYEDKTIDGIQVKGASVTTVSTTFLQVIGGSISGTVSLQEKSDYSGVSILAENNSTGKSFYAVTNSSGEFSWDSVAPGTYTISASYPGYKTVSLPDVVVSMGLNITGIVLPEMTKATYSVTGKVLLEGLDSGFEGTSVLLESTSTQKAAGSTTTGTDGTYTISDINPGDYILTVTRDGYLTDKSETVTVGNHAIEVMDDIILKNAKGSVKGNVYLQGAADYAGITILLVSDDNEKTHSTVTDSTGHYALGGVEPGSWRVQAAKSGYKTGISDPFTVSAGIISIVDDISLNISTRSIYGEVELEGRADFAGVKITATDVNNPSSIYSALTNSSGFYALSGMVPGEYILSYSFDNYVSVTSQSVNLESDSSKEMDKVVLRRATGKITGIVNLEGCTDHSGVLVSLVGTNKTFTTEADGVYEFSVPSGNYAGGVRFSREDFQLAGDANTITVLTDSTYGVNTVVMKCIAVPLKGTVDLAGSDDDSGITVSIDGNAELTTTSAEDGSWTIGHVPLGYQTVRFTKTNVPDVTTEKEVTPANYLEIGKITMIPNAATLKGYVKLNDMTDHSGITVTVTTSNRDDIVVKTNSDGSFEATNILSSSGENKVNHEITFSKEGWVSQTINIDDFEPLEERILSDEITLIDTTAPVISNVVINSGANYSNSSKLNIDLSTSEQGSGINGMSIQIIATIDGVPKNIYPSEYKWETYQIGFEYDLENLPNMIYSGNGVYTFVVTLKDKAGNISESFNKNITVTDVVTSLSGVLDSEHLHLTKERSPYLVEADCLVSEGDTLIIDSGVEVRFAGNYSIAVSGGIQARGTADEKILFTSDVVNEEAEVEHEDWHDVWHDYTDEDGNPTGDGYYTCEYGKYTTKEVTTVYWNGIGIKGGSMSTSNTYTYSSGNILEYCEFEYANNPVDASAGVYINHCNFNDCQSYVYIHSRANTVIFNSDLENGLHIRDSGSMYMVVNNNIKNYFYLWDCDAIIRNNTIENTSVTFDYYSGVCSNNIFDNSTINFGLEAWCSITNNNFINGSGILASTTQDYQSSRYFDVRGNYWGASNTEELEYKGAKANISFISDFYDNFNYMKINYSNWLIQSVENAGYLGDAFIAFDYTVNSFDFESGSYYPESQDTKLSLRIIPEYYKNEITQMRVAQSQSELINAEWENYSSTKIFDVDTTKLNNGYATMCVQIKDSEGNESSSVCHNVPFDNPVIECSIEDGTVYKNPASQVQWTWTFSDNSRLTEYIVYVDGINVRSDSASQGWDENPITRDDNYIGVNYMASGDHTILIKVWDIAGNLTTKEITFTVTNTSTDISSLAGISWDSSTGQPMKDDRTVYLWHLDNTGAEVDNSLAALSDYTKSKGGFNGAARNISTNSSVSIDLSTKNAFTIEFWKKGDGNIQIEKGDSFWINRWGSTRIGWYNLSSSGSINEQYFDVNSPDNPQDWHYWAYVYNGSYAAVYCDGQLMRYADGLSSTLNTNSNYLYINKDSNVIVDEIRISNEARSADEIAAYYKDAKAVLDSTTGTIDAIVY